MNYFFLSFIVSLAVTFLVVRSSHRHAWLSADHDLSGPQKFHHAPVPRIGGLALAVAVVAGVFLWHANRADPLDSLWLWLLAALPAFGSGLAEDLTKQVSPRKRLFFTAISTLLGIWLLDAIITRTDIPGLDSLISWWPLAMALTVFMVTGVTHAVNIIDGFNGLASACVFFMMLALAFVAYQLGDRFVLTCALISSGAILGFFFWNFPAGLIFLGDGGAYFLGFTLAELGVLLLARNESVSPFFPVLMCAYPLIETAFTMYRRRILKGQKTSHADGIHLHTLIHRRLVRHHPHVRGHRRPASRNSMTSPYLWVLCLLSVIPAALWWNSTPILLGFLLLFGVTYVGLYWRIVRFRVPKVLIIRC
jgi:UDP-N-acetylmuramyl pentapeptide phosphotransferase/UDP-N-acetylglucosamine-1-phosphate transferase